jgi:hypothetical protein
MPLRGFGDNHIDSDCEWYMRLPCPQNTQLKRRRKNPTTALFFCCQKSSEYILMACQALPENNSPGAF